MHIAMVSEHASPLAAPGSPDAGGQNVHVSELSRALAAAGHEVTVLTRRDDPALPELVPLHPGVVVRHVDAGPARPIPKDDLVPHLPALADGLERAWRPRRWETRTSRSSRPSTRSAASSDATSAAPTPARRVGSAPSGRSPAAPTASSRRATTSCSS